VASPPLANDADLKHQIALLAVTEQTTVQALVAEALQDLLKKRRFQGIKKEIQSIKPQRGRKPKGS